MPVPATVEGFIDWTRRPFRIEDADGPSIGIQAAPGFTGGNWTITERFPGEILTAAKYNADRQVMVDNAVPLMIDDYSFSIAQFQAATDPFPGGAPSLAVSLAGEIERIRFVLGSLNPDGHWYEVPSKGIHPAGGFKLSNNEALMGQRVDGSYGELIKMGTDDQIYIGGDQPAGKWIVLGSPTNEGAWVTGSLNVQKSASIRGVLTLSKGNWLHWDDIPAIAVGLDNVLYLGSTNTVHTVSQKYTYFPAGADITGLTVNSYLEANGNVHIDGALVVDGGVSFPAGNGLNLQKGTWITWQNILGIAVGTDDRVYIGSNAAGITLNKATYVNGRLDVAGDQSVGHLASNGTITAVTMIANNGQGVVDGVTTVRAWCRWVGGFAGAHGFAGGSFVGSGPSGALYQFTLARAYPNGYAVAVSIEGGAGINAIGRVIPLNSQVFQVAIMNTEDNPIGANFQLLVAGQV